MAGENIIVQMIAYTSIIPKKNISRWAMMKKEIHIGRFGGNNSFDLWNTLLK